MLNIKNFEKDLKEDYLKVGCRKKFLSEVLFTNKDYMELLIRRLGIEFYRLKIGKTGKVDIVLCKNNRFDIYYSIILASLFRCAFACVENYKIEKNTNVFLCGIEKDGLRRDIIDKVVFSNSEIVGESYLFSNGEDSLYCIVKM